jgi:hypothetical protein
MNSVWKILLWTQTTALVLFITMPSTVSAETIFLKDGIIIEGAVTGDAADAITVRKKDKKVQVIPRSSILRVLYTELYMGKVYVQKIDGKGIICYVVDEDKDSYTFRNDLFKFEEFKLRRDQVLFMARGNPTGLEGEADFHKVELKWFAPYVQVKQYRIYIKDPQDKDFRLIDESGSKNTVIKKLKSNTKYVFNVTAIDDSGDESLPSNQLTLTTKNMPPNEPELNPVESNAAGGYRITWKDSVDSDGKLIGYKIYRKIDGKTEQLADIKNNEYSLAKDTKFDYIFVSAYDDLKAESEQSRVYFDYKPERGISINPAFLIPAAELKKLASFGYGVSAKYELSNYIIPHLELNAQVSFFNLKGKDTFIEKESKINSFFLAPLMINGGYAFYPHKDVAIIPNISAGIMIVRYSYSYFDIISSNEQKIIKLEFKPAAGCGLTVRYNVKENIHITASADYVFFFEKSTTYGYISPAIGAGIWF